MAIGPILSELWPSITQQQGQRVAQALAATLSNPLGEGLTTAQKAELALKRFVKAVVKGSERQTKEVEIAALQAAVEQEFPEA